MTENRSYTKDRILAILPHRPPFLFVDEVVELKPDRLIVTSRELHPDEPHFKGHFPDRPIMPGVLVTDALAQTAGLLIGLTRQGQADAPPEKPEMFYLAAADMKYTSPAVPGDILTMKAFRDKSFGDLFRFEVEASVGRKLIARGRLTLAMVRETP